MFLIGKRQGLDDLAFNRKFKFLLIENLEKELVAEIVL